MAPSSSKDLVAYEELRVMARDSRHRVVRVWRPGPNATRRGTVVIGHGYCEHGGRYREFAHSLANGGFCTVALDLQGHGRSPGRPSYVKRFRDYHHDVATALSQAPAQPVFYLGHSLGGLIALDYFQQTKSEIAGLIVTNPYVEHAPPGLAAWRRKLGLIAGKIAPWLSVSSGLTRGMLTHDSQAQDALERDPLIRRNANASWFREVSRVQPQVRAIQHLNMPLLFAYSEDDPIASPLANKKFADQIQAPKKQIVRRPNELHEILFERSRTEFYDLIATWLTAQIS